MTTFATGLQTLRARFADAELHYNGGRFRDREWMATSTALFDFGP